ncbi:hypothetical protein O7047_20765, partial [Pseudenterobacter timonensis]
MAASPYPAYGFWLNHPVGLISEAPSGEGGKSRVAASPYPAYGFWLTHPCRPDKRSAIRRRGQKPGGGFALPGLRFRLTHPVGLISEAPSGEGGKSRVAASPYP